MGSADLTKICKSSINDFEQSLFTNISNWIIYIYIYISYICIYILYFILSVISDFQMKHSFFQAAIVSIMLYGCTTWTLSKQLEKKLDGNYTRMLRAILNRSWWQHPIRQQLFGHLLPITKTIQVKRPRHVGHCWRSRDELISAVTLHMADEKQGDQLEPIYSSLVRIWGAALRTYRMYWTIGRSGERGSGISALIAPTRWYYIYIYI